MGAEVFDALQQNDTGLPRMLEMAIIQRFVEIQVMTREDVVLQDAWTLMRDEGYFKFDDTPEGDADVDDFDEFQDFVEANRRSWET
jgi:hypothetical protein